MKEVDIKRNVRFIIERGNLRKKVMQINFAKSDLSFYTTFPYFDSYEFRCGTMTIPAGQVSLSKFNTELNSNKTLEKVKFSYHQSGIVTFKTLNAGKSLLSSIKAHDLSKVDWEHLFTLSFYEFTGYEDYTVHDNHYQDIVFKIHPERKLVRLIGYGGYDINKIVEVNGQPDFVFNLLRPGVDHVFHLAIYMDHKYEENFDIGENKSSILALVGFGSKATTINDDLSCLFLHANYK